MKRALLFAFTCAIFFVCSHRPAFAVVEFCPATLAIQAVNSSAGTPQAEAAALYGFDLSAMGPRILQKATLALDTGAGWFAVTVPLTTIAEKDRHYSGPSATFVHKDWVSPTMYVRFPSAVTIAHSWVYDAKVRADGPYGWEAKGDFQCRPNPARSPAQKLPDFQNPIVLDPKDEDRLSSPPPSGATILDGAPSPALGSTSCAEPFREATVIQQMQPLFPVGMMSFDVEGVSTIEVALDADGSLVDAWVWGPSGYPAYDASALAAATSSKYKNGRAYCQDVPSRYLFRVTFKPN